MSEPIDEMVRKKRHRTRRSRRRKAGKTTAARDSTISNRTEKCDDTNTDENLEPLQPHNSMHYQKAPFEKLVKHESDRFRRQLGGKMDQIMTMFKKGPQEYNLIGYTCFSNHFKLEIKRLESVKESIQKDIDSVQNALSLLRHEEFKQYQQICYSQPYYKSSSKRSSHHYTTFSTAKKPIKLATPSPPSRDETHPEPYYPEDSEDSEDFGFFDQEHQCDFESYRDYDESDTDPSDDHYYESHSDHYYESHSDCNSYDYGSESDESDENY